MSALTNLSGRCHTSRTTSQAKLAFQPILSLYDSALSSEKKQPHDQGSIAYQDIDCSFPLPLPFVLDYGVLDQSACVQARLVGPVDAPVILTLGGISANRYVLADDNGNIGWWQDFAGDGLALDTNAYRILSFDFLPGDFLPGDQSPDQGNDSYTTITPNDQARIAKVVCDYFGIHQLEAFVGASYGGMIALAFGQLFPESVKQLVVACAAHKPHPMGTAWRSIQRKIVRFGMETGQHDRALSLARELGMTTYRTAEEFSHRFSVQCSATSNTLDKKRFEVEDYLETRGQAFIGKMAPERYLSLSESIDLMQVNPAAISIPVTLIACRQDQLVAIDDIRQLAAQLPNLRQCIEFDSIYGHDAFLKEPELIASTLRSVLSLTH